MSVRVVLPSQLRELNDGSGVIDVGATVGTVAGAFDALRRRLPAVYDRVFTERSELRPHVNIFVGRDDIRWSGGLDTPVGDGAEIVILPSVSGG